MVDYATLVYDIDSAAAAKAAKALEKMGVSSKKAEREADRLARRFSSGYGDLKKFEDVFSDLDKGFNSGLISAQKYAAETTRLDVAMDLAKSSGLSYETALQRVDAAMDAAAGGAQRYGQAMRGSAMQTANVFAQLNDIGVMMAAGQNPIQLALQQGTQLNQVWASMGKEGKSLAGVAGVLRGAFASMISPMSLLTIGVIAGGAALVQFFTSTYDGSSKVKSTSDRIEELATSVSNFKRSLDALSVEGMSGIVREFGVLDREVASFIIRQKEFDSIRLQKSLSDAASGIESSLGSLGDSISSVSSASKAYLTISGELGKDSIAASEAYRTLDNSIKELTKNTGLGVKEAYNLESALDQVKSTSDPSLIAKNLGIVVDILSKSTHSGTELHEQILAVYKEALRISRVDIASGINTAAGAAQLLAERLNISLAAAQQIASLGSGVGAGRGGDPREFGSGWVSGFDVRDADAFLAAWKPPKEKTGGGGGALAQAQKQFQSLRELLEQETLFEVAEYEKRQAQLDNALAKKLLSIEQYEIMKSQLQTFYFGTEAQKASLNYQMSLEQLNLFHAQGLIAEEAYQIRLAQLRGQYAQQLQGEDNNSWSVQLSQMASSFGEMNQLAGGGYDALLKAQRIFGAASALISTYTGAAEALKLPFPANIAAMGKVLAAGMGLVSAIKSGSSKAGKGAASSASATAAAAKTAPTQYVTIDVTGDSWAVGLVEGVIKQIQEQTKDGRVVFMGNGR